jgi:vancomycin resistance protein VanJ
MGSHSESAAKSGRFGFAWWVRVSIAVYMAGLVAVLVMLRFASDAWWPASLILFGPRWVWGLPLLALVPLAAWKARGALPILAVAIVLFAWPLMSLNVAFGSSGGGAKPAGALRVMSFNIGGPINPAGVEQVLASIDPDVAVFQECSERLDEASLKSKGYSVELGHGMCIASRLPLKKSEMIERSALEDRTGAGKVMMYTLDFEGKEIMLFNLHLETIREGLEGLRSRKLAGGTLMDANIAQRNHESEKARDHANKTSLPLVLAGDFNLPVESAIYRRWWSDYKDGFSETGFGYGHTKETPLFGIRIDHVLYGPAWKVESFRVADGLPGFDHRPIVAELRLTEGS